LNRKSQEYIKDVLRIIKKHLGLEYLISLTLFGSQLPGKCNNKNISDCDLLIILSNEAPMALIKKCEKYIITLEIKHKFREWDGNLPKKALNAIQYSTGMFVSHFLTKKKFLQKQKFHKIFGVNRVFSMLFAPRKIVLSSVIENNRSLYGESIKKNIEKPKVPTLEIVKSLIMNLIISFFSLLISPFRSLKSIKYQLEAVKWSLRASYYYAFEDTLSLNKIIKKFSNPMIAPRFRNSKAYFQKFLSLREKLDDDILFMIRSPINILRIHRKGILFRKNFR